MATELPIGTRIKLRRQELGLRQQDLAERIPKAGNRKGHVNRTTVAAWEAGTHYPGRYLGAIESVLGIRLGGEPPRPAIPPGLLADMRRQLGDEHVATMLAALEETSAARAVRAERPGQRRRVDRRIERPVQSVDEKSDVVLPGGHAGAEARPRNPYARDDNQVPRAEARQ